MAQYAFEDLGADTAVIIRNVADDYAVGLGNYFQEAFVEFTGSEDSILAVLDYQKGTRISPPADYRENHNPDVILPRSLRGALMIRQARELGINSPSSAVTPGRLRSLSRWAVPMWKVSCSSTHYSPEATVTDISKEFVEFTPINSVRSNAFAALGFDAYMVILDATSGQAARPRPSVMPWRQRRTSKV